MKYKGYLIEEDLTGYAPKNSKFFIFESDEEKSVGYGGTIQECKEIIDKLILDK